MIARRTYIPNRGDIVWLDLNPVRGHEQSGRRPALIVSPKVYNAKSGLSLACPITSQAKGYPFEVVCNTKAIQGVILTDQIRAVDWNERKAKKIGTASNAVVSEVQEYLQKLITR